MSALFNGQTFRPYSYLFYFIYLVTIFRIFQVIQGLSHVYISELAQAAHTAIVIIAGNTCTKCFM